MPEPLDPYLIPGTAVLRNRIDRGPRQPYGTTDPVKLRTSENLLAAIRLAAVAEHVDEFRTESYDDMRALHRHIFQDVYDWAGEQRVWPQPPLVMSKDGHGYAPADYIAEGWRFQQPRLAALRGLDRPQFVHRLADTWQEINYLHAFREGNTRTQFAFFSLLAAREGYALDAHRFTMDGDLRQPFIEARFAYQDHPVDANIARLAGVLDQAIRPTNHTEPDQVAVVMRAAFPLTARQGLRRPVTEAEKQPPRRPPDLGLGRSGGVEL